MRNDLGLGRDFDRRDEDLGLLLRRAAEGGAGDRPPDFAPIYAKAASGRSRAARSGSPRRLRYLSFAAAAVLAFVIVLFRGKDTSVADAEIYGEEVHIFASGLFAEDATPARLFPYSVFSSEASFGGTEEGELSVFVSDLWNHSGI